VRIDGSATLGFAVWDIGASHGWILKTNDGPETRLVRGIRLLQGADGRRLGFGLRLGCRTKRQRGYGDNRDAFHIPRLALFGGLIFPFFDQLHNIAIVPKPITSAWRSGYFGAAGLSHSKEGIECR
jgi:hypothetical protein